MKWLSVTRNKTEKRNVYRENIDCIDLLGCLATWENRTDAAGINFSWINYRVTNDHEGLYGAPPPIVRTDQPRIQGKTGWVISSQGWHQYATWYRGQSYLPKHLRPPRRALALDPKHIVHLSGLTANLLTDHNSAFGHVQREAAHRLFSFETLGLFDDCNNVLIHALLKKIISRHHPDLMDRLNNKIIIADQHTDYTCDAVLLAPMPACAMNVTKPQLELLFRHLVAESPVRNDANPKKIYVDRGNHGARTIVNYEQILEITDHYGFERLSMDNVANPSELLFHADFVLGVHGSNLADVDFMREGTSLIEILPTDHLKPYHANSCEVTKAHYIPLLGRSTKHRESIHGPSLAQLTVDASQLDKVLSSSLSHNGG